MADGFDHAPSLHLAVGWKKLQLETLF
jgi:hypothetical protein